MSEFIVLKNGSHTLRVDAARLVGIEEKATAGDGVIDQWIVHLDMRSTFHVDKESAAEVRELFRCPEEEFEETL